MSAASLLRASVGLATMRMDKNEHRLLSRSCDPIVTIIGHHTSEPSRSDRPEYRRKSEIVTVLLEISNSATISPRVQREQLLRIPLNGSAIYCL